jgi:MFS transporter, CP family, cyanate transporter
MTLNNSFAGKLAGWGLLVVLGLNLRPILSSISPLLGEIRLATGLSFQSSALLTSLPVICMGLVALVGVRLEAKLGERRGIALGLMMILLACLARWLFGQAPALLATALFGGAGVALIQALVPAMIKRQFHQRVPLAMGVYSASLMGGGGLAALLSPHGVGGVIALMVLLGFAWFLSLLTSANSSPPA